MRRVSVGSCHFGIIVYVRPLIKRKVDASSFAALLGLKEPPPLRGQNRSRLRLLAMSFQMRSGRGWREKNTKR